jgi:5'(3')-deoxyribonucleotidase
MPEQNLYQKKFMIDPAAVAFDIDSVVADTMSLFIDIARDEFNINGIQYSDFTSYFLEECIDVDEDIIAAIIQKLLDGNYEAALKPFKGAPRVLGRLGREHAPVLFVTARPYPGPISSWIRETIALDPGAMEIVATGSFEAKTDILLERRISFFVEDRLETCFSLAKAGITPVLFKQPWNRANSRFVEVDTWHDLEKLIEFK